MKKIKELAFYCIPMIMIICSFITIFENTIWVDEAYSLELAKHSMIDLIKIDSLDVHPPLYYIILKVGYIILGGIPMLNKKSVDDINVKGKKVLVRCY